MARAPRMGASIVPLRNSRDRIVDMLGRVNESLTKDDEVLALDLMKEHEEVKRELRTYYRSLADRESEGQNAAVVLALGARMLSRVSSHVANIASTVASPFDQIRGTPISIISDAEAIRPQ